ncbi:MAG: DUF697 domain-containing protein [Planctomycetota bacterium]
MASFEALAGTARSIYRGVRYASLVFVLLGGWVLARETYALYAFFAELHLAAGIGFLVVFAIGLYYLIARPAWRYLRVPAAVRPPDVPSAEGGDAVEPRHLRARAKGLASYLASLRRNPNLTGSADAVERALAECRALVTSLGEDAVGDRERLQRFEAERVEPLLAPLDDQAREIIRHESMAIAVATALSPSGAADAYFVLWRNANMIARLAQLYYGRPGALGTVLVLRDVGFAVLVASQMQGIAHKGVETASGFLGKTASPVAGPVADGLVNGLVGLRVGYLAMRRCRAFRAFTEASIARHVQAALGEAARQSAGFATDLVTKVGVPLLRMPVDAGKRLVDWVSDSMRGWFGRPATP